MRAPEITVAIPAHRPRLTDGMLSRALASVQGQTEPAAAISLAVDLDHDGAWVTRQRALEAVRTEWVAFLDADDEFMPEHLEKLHRAAVKHEADYVFSYYMVRNVAGQDLPLCDPLQGFGRPWDYADPRQTTITTLVRTELAQAVGFKSPPEQEEIHGQRLGEDYVFTLGCQEAGAVIHHHPERTWWWYHHGNNTSGQPDRW
jgi:glycosyltransferase involved in cell wall biosynthesis